MKVDQSVFGSRPADVKPKAHRDWSNNFETLTRNGPDSGGCTLRAALPPGSPSWEEVRNMTMGEVQQCAKQNVPGFRTILKLLTSKKYDKP